MKAVNTQFLSVDSTDSSEEFSRIKIAAEVIGVWGPVKSINKAGIRAAIEKAVEENVTVCGEDRDNSPTDNPPERN